MRAHQESHGGSFLTSRGGLVLLAFLGIAAFYLVTEHTAHLFGALPYVLLLACPLLHLFMHGGHGHEPGGGHPHTADAANPDAAKRDRS